MVFHVPSNAQPRSTALTITGSLNEGELPMTPVNGALTVQTDPVQSVAVSIPGSLKGKPGDTVQVPVLIDNASGLLAADFQISYDTAIFDLADADIAQGHAGARRLGPDVPGQ